MGNIVYIMRLLSNTWREWPEVQTPAQRSNRSLHGTVQQCKKFLQSNKTNLATFLLKDWGKEQSRTRFFGEKVLYTTTKDYKVTQQGVHKVADLSSTHKEAETCMLLHACHASRTDHKPVILVTLMSW